MKKIPFILFFIILIQVSCKKKEDLSSFAIMNDKIEASNDNISIKNESLLEIIHIKAEKDDDLIPQKEIADRAHEIGLTFTKYLEELKSVIKKKNTSEFVDELFFNGQDITVEGEQFLGYIENYKTSLISTIITQHSDIAGMINSNFDIGSIKDRRGQQTNWLTLNYKGFPPIASVIKLSKMQSDAKRIETKLLSSLLNLNITLIETDIKESEVGNLDANTEVETEKSDSTAVKKIVPKTEVKEEPKIEPKIEPKEEIKKIIPKLKDIETHKVAPDETLYSISTKYNLTTTQLKKLNGMTNNNLIVGQKLRIK